MNCLILTGRVDLLPGMFDTALDHRATRVA